MLNFSDAIGKALKPLFKIRYKLILKQKEMGHSVSMWLVGLTRYRCHKNIKRLHHLRNLERQTLTTLVTRAFQKNKQYQKALRASLSILPLYNLPLTTQEEKPGHFCLTQHKRQTQSLKWDTAGPLSVMTSPSMQRRLALIKQVTSFAYFQQKLQDFLRPGCIIRICQSNRPYRMAHSYIQKGGLLECLTGPANPTMTAYE